VCVRLAWSQTPATKSAAGPSSGGSAGGPGSSPGANRRQAHMRPIPMRSASPASSKSTTTGGPGFGFEHFKQLDFLRDHEVVLTFDDGPWPVNTPSVLKALADECTTGIFFSIGKHATYYPKS